MLVKKTVKKIKNVLIISASFRPNSNSHALCQEVAKGVKAAVRTPTPTRSARKSRRA